MGLGRRPSRKSDVAVSQLWWCYYGTTIEAPTSTHTEKCAGAHASLHLELNPALEQQRTPPARPPYRNKNG